MVQVTANTSTPEHATVECLFLTQLPASCKVCYGIIPNCHNLSMTYLPPVPTSATSDGRATVILPHLENNLKYCYTTTAIVGADDDDDVEQLVVVVQGSFSTGNICFDGQMVVFSFSIFSLQYNSKELLKNTYSQIFLFTQHVI